MTLAAIMVFVDFGEEAEDRVSVAADIARRFSSLLIGVAGWPLRKVDAVVPEVGSTAAGEARQNRALEQLEQLGEKFRRCAGTLPQGVEWRSSIGFPRDVIPTECRAADLVVIGQEELPDDVYHTYDPGTIILAAGRPVLVIRRGIRCLDPSQVLIAWKDTRESRRAIRDALPFLKRAKNVSIAIISPPGMTNVDRQIADVVQYLARHQVSVDRQIEAVANENEGSILLDLAKNRDADLIVAGAYGRTRLSEWIFGGVTRQLLRTSTVPCLFAN